MDSGASLQPRRGIQTLHALKLGARVNKYTSLGYTTLSMYV